MKSLTQKEILELIKAKKLAPESLHVVSDYKEKEDEVLMAEAINKLAEAIKTQSMNNDLKSLILMLNSQLTSLVDKPQPEVMAIFKG